MAQTAGEANESLDGFRYTVVVLSVPRRAGKTTLNLAVNLDHLDVTDDQRGWYTCANGREVAAKLFRDEWEPMVKPLSRLYRIRKSQGSEGIHKRRGSSRLQLFAPTETALHSVNADTATVDEAWAASIEEGEGIESGITPAQLTRPWRQLWIVSAGGTIESTWLDQWITAGETGVPGVALFDYGADPTAPDYDPGSPETWLRGHPTAGVAFPLSVLEQEWARRKSDADFERPYLNVWPRPSEALAAAGLDLELWKARARPKYAYERVTAIAVDVTPDRSAAALAVAGPRVGHPDELVGEVIDERPGVGWLAAAARAARAQHKGAPIVADSLVAASVTAELERRGVKVTPIGASDHARACGNLIDRLKAGTVWHRSQAVLDEAVLGAARRPLGDAWLWSRAKSSANIAPLVSFTIAVWAASTRPAGGKAAIVVARPPQRNARTRTTTRAPFAAPRAK